jgi:spore coat protein U-like protein
MESFGQLQAGHSHAASVNSKRNAEMNFRRYCIVVLLILPGIWGSAPPPPASAVDRSVSLAVAPRHMADGQTVLFAEAGGQALLRYADILVTDASGQILPAPMELPSSRTPHTTHHASRLNYALRLAIDDVGTTYPLTVDNLLGSQVAKLIADDGVAGDVFGQPVAISGDVLVVGAHRADVGGNAGQGAAYVFYRNQGGANAWGQVAKVTASDGTAGDYFGEAVAISGDTVVVGAYLEGNGRGAVYVFYRDQGGDDNWGQVKKLTAADGAANDWFGRGVSVDGDIVVVGSRQANIGGRSDQGAAYIFYRDQGGVENWGQMRKLTADDGAAGDIFGNRVSLSGDTLIVGAPWADVGGKDSQGAAYVFYRDQGGPDAWGQVKKLTADDVGAGGQFGNQVSLSGDTLVVSAPHAEVDSNDDQGTAYVFYRDQGGANAWGQVEKLISADGAAGDQFGVSVSVHGNKVMVGARYADIGSNSDQGAAYVFSRDQGGANVWGQTAKLTADDGAADDWFGQSVAVYEDIFVVGAVHADVSGSDDQGKAYVYRLTHQVCLPIVLHQYSSLPLHIGDPIPARPVAYQGEVFYATTVRIPASLPTWGQFYFSSQPDAVAPVLVDDELAVLVGGVEIFSYDFSADGSPTPAILEVPRSMMEQLAGQIVSIEYRDVYSYLVEASDMWLIWVP